MADGPEHRLASVLRWRAEGAYRADDPMLAKLLQDAASTIDALEAELFDVDVGSELARIGTERAVQAL
ncbi:MAG: hypothetical protein ABR529_06685 [Actinomycetota bacterium]